MMSLRGYLLTKPLSRSFEPTWSLDTEFHLDVDDTKSFISRWEPLSRLWSCALKWWSSVWGTTSFSWVQARQKSCCWEGPNRGCQDSILFQFLDFLVQDLDLRMRGGKRKAAEVSTANLPEEGWFGMGFVEQVNSLGCSWILAYCLENWLV